MFALIGVYLTYVGWAPPAKPADIARGERNAGSSAGRVIGLGVDVTRPIPRRRPAYQERGVTEQAQAPEDSTGDIGPALRTDVRTSSTRQRPSPTP